MTEARPERIQIDETSWVDVHRNWLPDAEAVFGTLLDGVAWRGSRLFRYDHWVEENRLGAVWHPGLGPMPHPTLVDVHRQLQKDYGRRFNSYSMIKYRNGRDGQAFHRDTDMKWLDDTVIAILTLGAQRPWHLRPWANKYDHSESKGAVYDLKPANGDLIVMGGRCQADWQHSVPYLGGQPVDVRISLQWRHANPVGRPFQGAPYSAPVHYGRGRR